MRSFVIGGALAVLAGCSPRGALWNGSAAGMGGAGGAGPPSSAGIGAAGEGAPVAGPAVAGTAGAGLPVAICAGLSDHRPDQLALLGQSGAELVFIDYDGSSRRVPGPGAHVVLKERAGWVAAYAAVSATAWHVQLFDWAGRLRADASGAAPLDAKGQPTGIRGVTILSDGTTTVDLGTASANPILAPDGSVRLGPYYAADPDARGWVNASLPSDTAYKPLGAPVFLNVETGEVRRLSRLAAGDDWAPIVSPARRLYLATANGETVLVDESVDEVVEMPLPGWPRAGLEVDTVTRPDGALEAWVGLWDNVRKSVPLWLYDPATRTLTSALPDGTVPPDAHGTQRAGNIVDVTTAGARAWGVDLGTGVLFDYRAGLSVQPTRPPPGGSPDWVVLADNQKNLFRYDGANAALEDLRVAGDLSLSTDRARGLVTRDGHPREAVHVDDGSVLEIAGGDALAPAGALLAGRWAAGFESAATSPWNPGLPRWRVDLETAEARLFPDLDAGLTPNLGYAGGRRLGSWPPLLPDGRVGLLLYDGFTFRLTLGGPDAPWQKVGVGVRAAESIVWAAGPAFVIAAEKSCSCYGPIPGPWPPLAAGAPAALSGTSLQFVDPSGGAVFPPTSTEHLAAFADAGDTCALVRSDEGAWVIYDLVGRRRAELGKLDSLSWIADAP
jgi:hypothetical protein